MSTKRMATVVLPVLLVFTWLVLAPRAASAESITTNHIPSLVEWGVIEFKTPTKVFDRILMGKYIVVHDKIREARGEPCTTFHKIDESRLGRVGDIVVAFHCELVEGVDPTERLAAYANWGPFEGLKQMTSYQFGGRTEEHRVPLRARSAMGSEPR